MGRPPASVAAWNLVLSPPFGQPMRAKLGMPVLALGGAAMLGPMVEDVMRQAASDVRGAVIASCGRWAAAEQPQALVDHLVGFLGDGT